MIPNPIAEFMKKNTSRFIGGNKAAKAPAGLAWLTFTLGFLSLGTSAQAQGPVTVYQARGTLTEFDVPSNHATIECDAIPGLMGAETKSFSVHDPADFNKLIPGDILSFELCVSGIMTWVEHTTKTGTSPNVESYLLAPRMKEAAEQAQAKAKSVAVVKPVRLVAGDTAPDVELTDQSGRKIHLSDFKGDAVAITFMFTGCSVLNYCPLMSQNFENTQDLMSRMGAGDHWRLLSISMDPTRDTPSALTSFASTMHADPAHWTFATAEESKVSTFGASFGLEFERTGTQITHNLCTAVIDSSGRVHSTYYGNSWTPQQLAADLQRASAVKSK